MSLSCFGYGISLENKRSLDMAIPKHATRVHFAGWTSVVIETAGGDVEICGEYAPEEADLIQTLKDSRCALDDIHLYGWESLQGMMSSTGDVIGLCRRNSSSTLINEQEEEKGREERGEMSAPWVLFRNAKSVAACGQSTNHWTVAIDRSTGELYEWTALNPIPQPVLKDASFNSASSMLKSVKFERVWAGEAHMLAVTQGDGTLYSWGSGRYGQLGQGDLGSGTIPKPVEALEGIRIVDTSETCTHLGSMIMDSLELAIK
ncbi:E3 ubiquitin-protein ligase herc2 [Mortierella claussenii]|nr:E3 ubiquitin-protein ligase herc2 [Mortierella claussenii]